MAKKIREQRKHSVEDVFNVWFQEIRDMVMGLIINNPNYVTGYY
ncbi:hypothetical protein [Adhaeribacter aquaticus]|nr:hypothetical protein [Adhaeribacter aquaticus]